MNIFRKMACVRAAAKTKPLTGMETSNGGGASPASLRNTTPHLLAAAFIQHIMQPDLEWRGVDPAVTQFVQARVPMLCEFYQLWFFVAAVREEFGDGVSRLVSGSLEAILSAAGRPDFYRKAQEAIENARALGSVDGAPDREIGVDVRVSGSLLAMFGESESSKEEVFLPLAELLTYARIGVESTIPAMLKKVTFDPVSTVMIRRE